jgi:hypothetical protein
VLSGAPLATIWPGRPLAGALATVLGVRAALAPRAPRRDAAAVTAALA